MAVEDRFDIAVIGAGSAASSFVRHMRESDRSIVVFEPELVGGECPFLACVPSKSMLHDRKIGRSWDDAVARRDELVEHLDDTSHADPLRDAGATIVRERARLAGPGRVDAGGVVYDVDHVVVATGAVPVFPELEGLDSEHPRVWTHRDVLTSTDRPESIVVLGGGVIGSELAFMYSGFGTKVTTLDDSERPADDLHPEVSKIIVEILTEAGVDVVNEVEAVRVEATDADVTVHVADGRSFTADRLLVSIGRRPALSGLGFETVGVDADDLEIDDCGRIEGTVDGASIWIAGDAAGRQQYTHLANQHGMVIADHIAGDASRRLGDVVVPSCVFIDPPAMVVGDTYAAADDRIVWATTELGTVRHNTDEHRTGFMAVAIDPESRCIVAAHGIGAGVDELSHALVVAIDGSVPIDTLQRTIQPFPTLGNSLADVYAAAASAVDGQSRS